MLTKHVTVCLLITYHWAGSRALVEGVGRLPEAVGIVVEVNGSLTDARLNIPVVKRSSNQAMFANELRVPSMERSGRSVDDAGRRGGFFDLPHEYLNREKYNVRGFENHERERKERDDSIEIKSSTFKKDDGLIGRANSLVGESIIDGNFYYDEASTSAAILANKREKRDLYDVTNLKVTENKIVLENENKNDGRDVVDSVFPLASKTRIRRDTRERGIRNSVDSVTRTIDSEYEKQRKQRQEDYDTSGVSRHRLSAGLSPLKPMASNPYKLTSSVDNHKQIVLSKRLHQQSRNTQPRTIIQHRRRNTKRQAFDDDPFLRSKGFLENQANSASTKRDSQFRFIPAGNHHRADNRVYFQRFFKPLIPSDGSQGSNPPPFIENSEANSRTIPRFNVEQLDKLKNSIRGVFDKYEARQKGQIDLLPNVRMIQSKQIYVAPTRVIYDTKILPAPDSFNRYFQDTSSNTDTADRSKVDGVTFAMKGVFDQSHEKSHLDQREVIPVREDSAPSLTSSENFVTPLPPYQVGSVVVAGGGERGGGGEEGSIESDRQVLRNQPSEDSKLREIYRVREEEMRNSGLENESQLDNDDDDDEKERNEDSRLDHESPIDVEAVDHFRVRPGTTPAAPAGGGSSYDNLEITSVNQQHESGSTNVDHSNNAVRTIDEYANSLNNLRTRNRTSKTKSNGNSYDRGNYKWRNDDHHDRYAANYSFGYRVSDYETENEFGHQETRKEGITMGKYHVKLPDGRIQKVNYHVDDDGYHASVSYHRDNVE